MNHSETVSRKLEFVARIFFIVAAIALSALFLLMFGDVVGRFAFNAPFGETAEIGEYLLVAVAFLALGFAQFRGMHVRMEAAVSHFSARAQIIVYVIVRLLAIGYFAIMTMQIGKRAYMDWAQEILLSLTTLRLPTWWLSFIAFLGCAVLTISLLTQVVSDIIRLMRSQQKD